MRLLFVVNAPEFFLSHRLPIALEARRMGFDVHVATGSGEAWKRVRELGFNHYFLPISRSEKNPIKEAFCFWSLYCLIRNVQPDIAHFVTIKPVLYGGIAARMANVSGVVSAISGLGTIFVAQGLKSKVERGIIRRLYRIALGHPNSKTIFQNFDDLNYLVETGAVDRHKAEIIRGSGVELEKYPVKPEPHGMPVVALAARLLRAKGVYEFVEAARLLKEKGIKAKFQLIGSPDPGNPDTITDQQLDSWRSEDVVDVLGYRSDIPELFSKSNIVVLPSYYREGLPKVLIEAAASGRAIITTDQPGCRDAIIPGKTGLLVPAKDPSALADAIERLLRDTKLRNEMGKAGRLLAEREFDVKKVVNEHIRIYFRLLKNKN